MEITVAVVVMMGVAVGETFKEMIGWDGMLALIHGDSQTGRLRIATLGTTRHDTNGLTWIQLGKDTAAVLFFTSISFHPFTLYFRVVRSN